MLQVEHFISFFLKFKSNLLLKRDLFLLNVIQYDAQIICVCTVLLGQLPQTVMLLTLYLGGTILFPHSFLSLSRHVLGCTLE
jgi:hypothetical protein